MSSSPGQLVVWTSAGNDGKVYSSHSLHPQEVVGRISSHLKSEVVIVFTSGTSVFSIQPIRRELESSSSMAVYPNIYREESSPKRDILTTVNSHTHLQPITLEKIVNVLEECFDSCIFNDAKVDAFHIELQNSPAEEAQLLQLFTHSSFKNAITFVAINEPELNAFKPTQLGHYHALTKEASSDMRRLMSNTSSNSSIAVDSGYLYKPEGAEYSIYYANTYLYITPGIILC